MSKLPIVFALSVLLFAANAADAEIPFSSIPPLARLERMTTHNGEGDRLDLIVGKNAERRPVLVFLPGSVCIPTMDLIDMGSQVGLSTTSPVIDASVQASLGVHIALLERRNLVSMQKKIPATKSDVSTRLAEQPCTARHGGVTLEHRVDDTFAQLDLLRRQDWAGPLLLVGTSEGADVATAVSADPRNSAQAVLLISGAGTSQFFDFVHQQRQAESAGGVRKIFDDLDKFLSGRPPSPYLGYDAARWKSFAIDASPLEHLLRSEIPVFIAHGERDESVPIASSDVLVVELMRRQPQRAIFYWSVAGADHGLQQQDRSRYDEVIGAFVRWSQSAPRGRTFRND
jgi:pimeloyl-ACP methyl ester carboxylesterase